jgi:cobaltochelatase CobT
VNGDQNSLGPIVNSAFLVSFFGLFFAAWWKAKRGRQSGNKCVDDGPEDTPYRVFTTRYDVEMHGRDVAASLIKSSPDFARNWLQLDNDAWLSAQNAAENVFNEARNLARASLEKAELDSLERTALTLLIDQSGSMKGEPIQRATAVSRLAVELLSQTNWRVEVLGFSTAGWQGGYAYRQWIGDGRPKRPGRLCALRHVVYKQFEETEFDKASWRAMLNPNVLRENVDGEAIEWAASRLEMRSEQRKFLIVVSDGASVDDATLMHNGPSYLERHLQERIRSIEQKSAVEIGAIGIGYDVGRYYSTSMSIKHPYELHTALFGVLKLMIDSARRDTAI